MTDTALPSTARRLETDGAKTLVDLVTTFEDLQTVLRCCERLVTELDAGGDQPDDILLEAVWTTALLSYARCFAARQTGAVLTEDELTATVAHDDVLDWHRVLLRLREHYADPAANPRERFSVGVAQDDDGSASGIVITSARQPLVDDVTVRQTGAIAFALSSLVDDRIAAQQQTVYEQVTGAGRADLDNLALLDIAPPD